MNREHPTRTERKPLNYECGWKGDDRGGLAERKKFVNGRKLWKRAKKLLTGIGLLMEELSATTSGLPTNRPECADRRPPFCVFWERRGKAKRMCL